MAEQEKQVEEHTLQEKTFFQKLKNPLTNLIIAWAIFGTLLTLIMHYGFDMTTKEAMSTAWAVPNFLILASILWYFGRTPMKDFLSERREEIVEGMDKAEKMKTEAEAKQKDLQSRLDNIEGEIKKLGDSAKDEAELEKRKLIEEAEKQAQRIKNDAEFTAKQELKKAQAALRAETAALAVEMAEKILKQTIDDQDRQRLLDEYIDRVEAQQ